MAIFNSYVKLPEGNDSFILKIPEIALDLGESMKYQSSDSHHVFLFSLLEGLFLDSPEKLRRRCSKMVDGPPSHGIFIGEPEVLT